MGKTNGAAGKQPRARYRDANDLAIVEYEKAYAAYVDAVDKAEERFDARVRDIIRRMGTAIALPPLATHIQDDAGFDGGIIPDGLAGMSTGVTFHGETEGQSFTRTRRATPSGDAWETPCTRAILETLARFHPRPLTQKFIAVFAGYSIRSGSWSSALAALRKRHMIATHESGKVKLEPEGLRYAPPTGRNTSMGKDEVRAMWRQKLDPCARHIFDVLSKSYPKRMSGPAIAVLGAYSVRSGSWSSALAKLRKLDLIEGTGAALGLSPDAAQALALH